MKTTNARDFQRNLYQQKESCIVTRNGQIAGYWLIPADYEALQNADGQASASQNTALEGQEVTGINETVPVTIEEEPNSGKPERCKVCNVKIYTVWYSGKYWNEGEEMDLDICAQCYKRHKPKGFKKHEPTVSKRARR